jgi:hypothetical protein
MKLMRYFDDQYDEDELWEAKLREVREGTVPSSDLPGVIVRLGKPLVQKRIHRAQDVIIPLLKHPDPHVRYQAAWFFGWGKVTSAIPYLIASAETDDDEWVRGYAVRTIGRLASKDDLSTRSVLVRIARNNRETEEVQKSAYGAILYLLGGAYRNKASAFEPIGDGKIVDFDWGLLDALDAPEITKGPQ